VTKDAWLRAGKEFFPVETDILNIAEQDFEIMLRGLNPGTDLGERLVQAVSLRDRYRGLKDRLYLVPFPETEEGNAIRSGLGSAFETLGQLVEEVISLQFTELRSKSTTGPSTPPEQDFNYVGVFQLKEVFDKAWQRARGRLLDALRRNSIAFSDLGIRPTPTATKAPPAMPAATKAPAAAPAPTTAAAPVAPTRALPATPRGTP